MPSTRCATSAKRSGNCSSAVVTNRMACQSRCEIQVRASRRRLLSACSRRSTPRNRAVWGLGCRSAGRLSKRITDDCGRAPMCHVAPHLNSPCLPIQTLHRDWCLGAAAACLVRLKAIALVKSFWLESWKTLVSVWAYHSFSGEVEASNTTTIRRLIPSCRHQLSRLAPRWSAGLRMRQVMVHRDPSSPTPMPTILRYGIAVLSVAIAIALGFFVLRHFEAILTPFLFAVAATVWYAGTRPGVLATVLSVLSLNYFFLRPDFSFSPISYADLVYLTFCIFCALAVGWVSAVQRRAAQELRQAREEFAAKVVERTANLQRSEGYLAEAQKLTHTGSWAWDPRTEKVLYCSEEMFRIFGLDPRESLPSRDNFRQQIHPEDRDWVKKKFEESLRERVDTFAEYRVLLPDGTVRHINASGHPVLNEDGELIEFIGTATDATERKRAEAVGQRLAAIVDFSEDAIVSKDLNGTIESWNGGAERLFGYQASEVIGKSILIIIPPDRHDEELGILECIRRGEHVKSYETVRMRKDGSLLDISLTVSPLKDAAGRIIGASKIARDITERKRAEEALRDMQMQLAHANRVARLGQLTASITHEVNQPITAAVTYALAAQRWLSAESPNVHEVDDALSLIVKEGNRAGEVVGRIRALIKKAPARKDAVAINDAILEVIALTRSEAASNSVSVRTQLAEGLPRVQGDRVQLQQVLLNLIINAIDAMRDVGEEERELLISSRDEPDGVSVEVRDSGPDFAPKTLEHVLAAFYTTKPGGLGMGLSICRSIIEAHHGRLWASGSTSRGAVFQFTLPAYSPAE